MLGSKKIVCICSLFFFQLCVEYNFLREFFYHFRSTMESSSSSNMMPGLAKRGSDFFFANEKASSLSSDSEEEVSVIGLQKIKVNLMLPSKANQSKKVFEKTSEYFADNLKSVNIFFGESSGHSVAKLWPRISITANKFLGVQFPSLIGEFNEDESLTSAAKFGFFKSGSKETDLVLDGDLFETVVKAVKVSNILMR